MSTQRNLRVRNRTILILLLPPAIFLFAIGWLLNCFGDLRQTRQPQRKQASTQDNGIQIQVATIEESQQYND